MRRIFAVLVVIFLFLPLSASGDSTEVVKKAMNHAVSVQEDTGAWSRLKGEFPGEAEPTSWAVKAFQMKGAAFEETEKGTRFLVRDQKPNGSWNDNTAHTAFAILALSHNKPDQELASAIGKGISYLRSVQTDEGGFRRIGTEGPPLTIYTAVVLEAFSSAGIERSDPAVRRALDWLMGCQNADGGYPIPKEGISLSMSTAWVVRAFLGVRIPSSSPFLHDAVSWLLTTQKPSGGFAATPGAPEDPEITAYAIMALARIPLADIAVKKAAVYLEKVQHTDGMFTSNTPVQFDKAHKKNTQTTLFVIWALSDLHGTGKK